MLSPTARRLADRILAAACVVTIAFLLLQLMTFGYGRDQGIYAMVARAVLDGKMPYRDAWDFKPPGIYMFYAVSRALFGSAQWGIRLLEVLGLALTVVAMVRLSDKLWAEPSAGLVGGALAVVVHAQLDFWHTAQPESFGGMLSIAALLLAAPSQPGPRERRRGLALSWVGAGILFGACGLLKPPLGAGAVMLAAALAWRAYRAGSNASPAVAWGPLIGQAARPAAWIAAGSMLPVALCIAWFAAKGALGAWAEVLFEFTPQYTALSWSGASVLGMIQYAFTDWFFNYSSLMPAGLLLLAMLRPEPHERWGVVLFLSIIGIQLVGIALQGKFFPYHYGAIWPLTGLLAGLGFCKAWRWAAQGVAPAGAFLAAVVLLAFSMSATRHVPDSFLTRCEKRSRLLAGRWRDTEAIDQLATVADVDAGSNRQAAQMLAARVAPDRSVLVWGFEPVIYDLADRRPATRYLYNVPQRVGWGRQAARQTMMHDLEADPPAAIVVEQGDIFPAVTGNALDSAGELEGFDALQEFLWTRYEKVAQSGDLEIWVETSPRP